MAYFPQAHPDFNGLRHLLLLYGNAAKPWKQESLTHAVAHLDEAASVDDWFFDSFLFLNAKSSAGRDFSADINRGTTMSGEGDFYAVCSPEPALKEDWDELLEFYLGSAGAVSMLDQTIAACAAQVRSRPEFKHNVVLMLPYPHITQGSFGKLERGHPSLNFSVGGQNLTKATAQRLRACEWFVDEITGRFRRLAPEHVHLLGVYWMFETVYRSWDVDDHWLLKELRKRIHAHGLKFLWIPFWSAYNVHLLDDYRSYYFDCAFLQPNYMFYRRGASLASAAEAARQRNAGIEMEYYLELNEPIAVEGERHKRFREYLDGGLKFGYMRESVCAHFQGVGALERMRTHKDPQEREFYEDIFAFVKGRYRAKGPLA
jgi:hypothetical protein